MQTTLHVPRPTGARWARCIRSGVAVLAASLLAANVSQAAPSQTYFVPIPETQVHETLSLLNPENTSSVIESVVSIAVAFPGTTIRYDHWEDGYEADFDNPAGPTTEIWGDGNLANGFAPGHGDDDLLKAGDVIILKNAVATAPRGTSIRFDGSDKFKTSEPVAVTRVAWAGIPGTVLAGAVEVFPTSAWGTSFEAPVGEDVVADNMFELVTASIMAMEDDTVITFDFDGMGGPPDLTVNLDQGESFLSPLAEGFPVGNKASSNKPVQVHAITGDIGTKWESRWAVVLPTEIWSDEYFLPVSTRRSNSADPTDVFIYNPDPAGAIEVTWEAIGAGATVNVPSRGVTRIQIPNGPGANDTGSNFRSTGASAGKPFYAIAVVDANADEATNPNDDDSNLQNRDYDWGISLIPMNLLSTQALVGFAPGIDPNACAAGSPFDCPIPNGLAGSPVWVMAADIGISSTTVYIDYDADPTTGANTDSAGNQYDTSITLARLERHRVFDPNDNDMTGALLYTLDGTLLALAWGQDPENSVRTNPYFDAGTLVPGLTSFAVTKDVDKATAAPGDILNYSIEITNSSRGQISNMILEDTLPGFTSYVAGSATLDGSPYPDDGVGTAFPLDEGGINLGAFAPGESMIFRFQAVIDQEVPASMDPAGRCDDPDTSLINTASGTAIGITRSDDALTCVDKQPDIDIRKQAEGEDLRTVARGEPVSFEIVVTNTGQIDLLDVAVTDEQMPQCDNVIGALAVGDSVSYSCELDAIDSSFVNIACVAGSAEGIAVDDCDPSSVEVIDIDIRKQAEGPDSRTFPIGSDVTFAIVVTNTGPEDLVNVVVTDPLATDCNRDIGPLASGASVSYDCTSANVQAGFTNIAKVSGERDGQTVMDEDPSTVEVDVMPAIDVRKQAEGPDSRTFVRGADVSFEIVVTNTGDVPLTAVTVTDALLPQCDRDIGDLAVAGEFSYFCTAPAVSASFVNVAKAKGMHDGEMVMDEDPSTVEIIDIDIRKQAEGPDSRTFPMGADVTFDIVVTNTGSEDLANVMVTDPLSTSCNNNIGALAAGASVSYQCTRPGVLEGFTNIAKATGERNGVMVMDDDPSTVEVEAPQLCSIVVDKTCVPIDDDDDGNGGDDDDDGNGGGDDDDDGNGGGDDDDDGNGGDDDDDGNGGDDDDDGNGGGDDDDDGNGGDDDDDSDNSRKLSSHYALRSDDDDDGGDDDDDGNGGDDDDDGNGGDDDDDGNGGDDDDDGNGGDDDDDGNGGDDDDDGNGGDDDDDGGSPMPQDACTIESGDKVRYDYRISNIGDTNVEITSVFDNKLAEILQGGAQALGAGEQLVLSASTLLTTTTTNIVNVTARVAGHPGAVCDATDEVTVTVEEPIIPTSCKDIKDITAMTMVWDGPDGVDVVTDNGQMFSGLQRGTEITFAVDSNDTVLTLSGAVNGTSVFHKSCSDAEMDHTDDCGKPQGNGKKNNQGMNSWRFQGLTGEKGDLSCHLPTSGKVEPTEPPPGSDISADPQLKLSDKKVKWKLTNDGDEDVYLTRIEVHWPSAHKKLKKLKLEGDFIKKFDDTQSPSIAPDEKGFERDSKKRKLKKGKSKYLEIHFDKKFKDNEQDDYIIIVEFDNGQVLSIGN